MNLHVSRSAVIAVVLVSVGIAAAQGGRTGQILEQAGQMEQAYEEYRSALNSNPGDAVALQGLVRLSRTLNRFDTLAAVTRRLARAQPENPEFAIGLIEALFGLKRRNDGLAELRRSAKAWPDRLPQLADVAARSEEYAEAVNLYVQARERAGQDLLYSERLVDLYEKQGQRVLAAREVVRILNRQSEALGVYAQKLSAYAGKTDIHLLLAELEKIAVPQVRAQAQATVYLSSGRDAEAVRLLAAALSDQELYRFAHELETQGRLNPALMVYQRQNARADAARVLRRMGREQEALAELAQDTGYGAQFERAELLRERRAFRAAADAYSQVLVRQPGHEAALFGLASVQLGGGDLAQAQATARRIVRPTDRVLFLLARVHFYAGRFDSAKAVVDTLVRQHAQSPLVNDGLELAVLALSVAKDEASLKELARAMLGYETGDEAGAEQAARLARAGGPVAEYATLLLARFRARAGKPGEARLLLEGFADRFPASSLRPKARLELARLYHEALKDDGKYRETLERLLLEYPGSPYAPVARSLLAALNQSAAPAGVR